MKTAVIYYSYSQYPQAKSAIQGIHFLKLLVSDLSFEFLHPMGAELHSANIRYKNFS